MPAKNYKVERKDIRIKFRNTGEQFTVYRIWATTAGFTLFMVEIEETELGNADKVLSDKAAALDALK